ncbi:MAG: hypothetical protein GKR92_02325 [Gammaproteobacteria bacterium]|nr:MAG: hypothetical protein GKR92_02325 [Gammaproteobacteria bacterium]
MYISNELSNVSIQWTVICNHEYKRLSRTKWRIDFHYKCGAEMTLEDISDDMIQCLILGAFNSKKEMKTNLGEVNLDSNAIEFPVEDWKALQPLIVV